jgi:hypothetical protein
MTKVIILPAERSEAAYRRAAAYLRRKYHHDPADLAGWSYYGHQGRGWDASERLAHDIVERGGQGEVPTGKSVW